MSQTEGVTPHYGHRETSALIFAVFVAGLCSIIYQLLISTTSSYFLGDSVRQFSLTMGLYMASMGAGAWLSRFVKTQLIRNFVYIEIALGFLGGGCVPILYFCYSFFPDAYLPCMIGLSLSIGLLIGFEIPLLTRILERCYSLKLNISNVLSIDYLGALIATLLFPFLLLPLFGTFRSSLIIGLINLTLGFLMLYFFGRRECGRQRLALTALNGLTFGALALLLAFAHSLTGLWSQSLYSDQIIHRRQTPYQKIVLTRYADDTRLFLDGNLQFSSRDEHRYHECLVHPAMAYAKGHGRILVLGGGDGLAVRELLKYPEVRSITLVDLDPAVTELAKKNPLIRELNADALTDKRVEIHNLDAMQYLVESTLHHYDVIIADLPDPNNVSLARLYSREFFNLAASRLSPGGVFVTQSTSPYFAKRAFWMIHETLAASDFSTVIPYNVNVPSFGVWGFNLALPRPGPINPPSTIASLPADNRYLDASTFSQLFVFPADLHLTDGKPAVSTLDDPKLIRAYLKEWNYWR